MNIQNYSTPRDKFNKEKKVSKETLENFGDPLLEQQPQLLISKKLLDQKFIESVKSAKYIGNHQFKLFVRERLIERA